jgi:hypothetical protein
MGADEARYAFHNYGHLMTPKEKLAFSHLGGTMKATLGRSDRAAQEEVKNGSTHLRKFLSDDPEVLILTRDGYDAFVLQTGERILNDNQGEIVLNYCPRCKALTRTPKARQCRFCGNDWHTETGSSAPVV